MDLSLTDDQEFFASTTRKYLEDKCPVTTLRSLRNDPKGFEDGYWRGGAELGWAAMLVSEEHGGGSISDHGLSDLALIAFEFGRHAAPGPLLPANVVAAALSRWGTDEQRAEVLDGIIAGEIVPGWASAEPRPNERLGRCATTATPDGGGFVIDGRKAPVEAGGQASQFLVSAQTADGLTHLLVPADAEGVTVTPMGSADLTRRFAAVSFDNVSVPSSAVVGTVGGAGEHSEQLLQLAIAIQLHEVTGAMDKAFEITMEWMFDRYSFGRPLASYQELKHRMADNRSWLEAAHGISDAVTQHINTGSEQAGEYCSAGKVFTGLYGPEMVQDCVQMHGGIGVTFEHDMHLYLRRTLLGATLYGTVSDHRLRLTDMLEAREDAA